MRGRPGILWLTLVAVAVALAPFRPLSESATGSVRREAGTGLAGAEDQAEELKARLDRENDPIKKARLEIRLAEMAFDEARKLYEKGDAEKGLARLQEMLSFVVSAHDHLQSTGRDPRKRPSGFKETEIKLRELSRRLEDLRVSLPIEERGEIEKIAARIVEIRDHLLRGLMRVKGAKK